MERVGERLVERGEEGEVEGFWCDDGCALI